MVRHKVLVEKRSKRSVAKEHGISRNTVKRYVEGAPVGVRSPQGVVQRKSTEFFTRTCAHFDAKGLTPVEFYERQAFFYERPREFDERQAFFYERPEEFLGCVAFFYERPGEFDERQAFICERGVDEGSVRAFEGPGYEPLSAGRSPRPASP